VTGIRDFVWILAVPLAINAQLANGDPGCGKNVSFRPGVSPFDIVAGNPPLPNLWARLGIPARLKASSGNEINCLDGCEASIVSSDYLLPAGNDTVVRVCTAFGDTCRFLLLHQSSSVWSLVDYLDTDYDKYELPTAWIEASQDQRWLVKSSFGGGGTGVYLGIAEWFEIRCGALENILKVPLKGHDVNAKPARYFSTRFKGFHKAGQRESLEFSYLVRFDDYGDAERELWQEERTVVFSRTNRNSKFTFDPTASNIPANFEEKIFAFDSMNENDFVAFAYNRLLKIARDPTDSRRVWLSEFLRDTAPGNNATALKRLLEQNPGR
jgi:hypothetical protein